MSDQIIRIEMEHADGSIQRLTGAAAAKWLEEVNGLVMMAAFRHGRNGTSPMSDFDWEWTNKPAEAPR